MKSLIPIFIISFFFGTHSAMGQPVPPDASGSLTTSGDAAEEPIVSEKEEPGASKWVIGENIKVAMPIAEAVKLLGIPESYQVKRGTVVEMDSIAIDYSNWGMVVHFLSKSKTVEGIELKKEFKGRFASGIKIGSSFEDLIAKYGTPNSLMDNIVRYSDLGLYFVVSSGRVVSAKAFVKNSKILARRQIAEPVK